MRAVVPARKPLLLVHSAVWAERIPSRQPLQRESWHSKDAPHLIPMFPMLGPAGSVPGKRSPSA